MARKRRNKGKVTETVDLSNSTQSEKEKMLNSLIWNLESKFWKWIITKKDQVNKVPTISTNIKTLDNILWWWLPVWRIVEIYWAESSGKTTFSLHMAAMSQKDWGNVAYIDMEQAVSPEWASKLWVDMSKLVLSQPDFWEQAWDLLLELTKSWLFNLIIVDSVAAMIPKAELEWEMEDQQMWLQARMLWKLLRKLTPIANKTWTTIIFINQTRQKIWVMFGSPETTPWGNALKFAASQRIKIFKKDKITENDTEVGYYMKFQTIKNKITFPKQDTAVKFLNWQFDYLEDLIEYLVKQWKIKKAWAFLSIIIDWEEYKGQGKEKFKQLIIENNLYDYLYNLTWEAEQNHNDIEVDEEEILEDVE